MYLGFTKGAGAEAMGPKAGGNPTVGRFSKSRNTLSDILLYFYERDDDLLKGEIEGIVPDR